MIILGLGNKARNGKDTAASAIKLYYDTMRKHQSYHAGKVTAARVQIFGFADALYEEVNDWLAETFSGFLPHPQQFAVVDNGDVIPLPTWVQPDPTPEVSPRSPLGKHPKLLQWWGTEYRRAQNVNYWTERLEARIKAAAPDIALVTDMRFKNEAAKIKEMGGHTVLVERINDDGTQYIDPNRPADHPSETELDGHNYDYFIKTKSAGLTSEQAVTLIHYIAALEE